MTCCVLSKKQDAILGHVASRGDRNPRSFNKAPAVFIVNPPGCLDLDQANFVADTASTFGNNGNDCER
jgi:hypothetical protein